MRSISHSDDKLWNYFTSNLNKLFPSLLSSLQTTGIMKWSPMQHC